LNFPAVRFELRLARSAGADSTAEARHRDSAAGQAGQQIGELRQFHLQLSFAGSGAAGEDVENELRSIDDAAIQFSFEVPLLRRREFVIEDDQVRGMQARTGPNLVYFTRSDQRCRIRAVALLHRGIDHVRAGAARERSQFLHRFFETKGRAACGGSAVSTETRQFEANQNRALDVILSQSSEPTRLLKKRGQTPISLCKIADYSRQLSAKLDG
jgi:hypothetical protein